MDSLIGISFGNWIRLLMQNKFQIDPPYWLKAGFISVASLYNTRANRMEAQKYAEILRNGEIEPKPIFILGHWRSGTTFLHRLLALNPLFAYPNAIDIYRPASLLINREKYEARLKRMAEKKRPMDNVRVSYNSPAEEEFAIAVMSLRSPLLGWVFPRNERYYNQYLTFTNASENDRGVWKQNYLLYLKKIVLKNKKEFLVLKSPANTGRIRLLLQLFPEAKFIHIRRNPYAVFLSMRKLYRKTVLTSQLQQRNMNTINKSIVVNYKKIYHSFFRDWDLIPEHNRFDLAFEDLEKAPKEKITEIYHYLNLPGFDLQEPILEKYLTSLKAYKKNQFPELPTEIKKHLRNEWKMTFDRWGYTL